MATLVQITGPSGSGKSFSIKPLVDAYPSTVAVIDADGRGLAWAGWRKQFSKEKNNYYKVSDPNGVVRALQYISKDRPDIKVAVVDTLTKVMNVKERTDMSSSGYNKWEDYARVIFDIYTMAHTLRDDLIIVFTAHVETYDAPNGEVKYRTSVAGKKSKTRWNINAHLTYNLYTDTENDGQGKIDYYFVTQNDGTTEARTVYGVFDDFKIPNDLKLVVENIWTRDLGLDSDQLKQLNNATNNAG